MPDLLVKLYEIGPDPELSRTLGARGITIGKPIGSELGPIRRWFRESIGEGWLGEFEVSLQNRPRSCFVARLSGRAVGFACYDATALGFVGPLGVLAEHRGIGVGRALLLAVLVDMRSAGYGYAVIGDAAGAAIPFYRKCAAATVIEDSDPGLYGGALRPT